MDHKPPGEGQDASESHCCSPGAPACRVDIGSNTNDAMIPRTHGLILSLLLGGAAAAGAYALIGTAKLTDAQTKPEVVTSRQIAKRARKLDEWEASLQKALAAKPPALAPLNRYAAVLVVPSPGSVSMPTIAIPSTRDAQLARAPTRKRIPRAATKKPSAAVAAPTRDVDIPRAGIPIDDDEPERAAASPAAAPAAAPPAAPSTAQTVTTGGSATQNTPAPPVTPSPSQSAEKQCEALKQAAEGKGEQAKKDAERACEALKQAAERAKEGERGG